MQKENNNMNAVEDSRIRWMFTIEMVDKVMMQSIKNREQNWNGLVHNEVNCVQWTLFSKHCLPKSVWLTELFSQHQFEII